MSSTFEANAAAYWSRGLSVVPVTPGAKQTPVKQWPSYCNNVPSVTTRDEWRRKFGDFGIALLLGTEIQPGVRIVAIDVDDDTIVAPVSAIFAPRCAKVGRKGLTIFVQTPSEAKIKSATLKGPGGHVGDLLANGKMTVIPPTDHPETKEQYRWVGSSILDISFADLPVLDQRTYAVLGCICRSEHVQALKSGDATHTAALQFVAQLVKAGAGDDEIQAVVGACLPAAYAGDTLEELQGMIRSAREKGFAPNEGEEKDGPVTMRVIDLCMAHGVELFHWEDRAFLSFPTPEGGALTYAVRSYPAERRIRQIWYERERQALRAMTISEVMATFEAKAFAEGGSIPVWNRVGEADSEIFIDLGRRDGLLVRIGAAGWRTVYDKRLKFRRPEGFKELPVPEAPGNLRALQEFLGLQDEAFYCVVGFLISSLGPIGPYFGLIIEGEMGSGKSYLASTIKALLDPSDADRLALPSNDRDLAIHANQFRVLSYDNTSGMKAQISDALCVIATGGGLATRKLYTDGELTVLKTSRPFILNGISGYARRADLLERAIYVHLERVSPDARKEERGLAESFRLLCPKILAGLYDALSRSLDPSKEGYNGMGLRMADAARRIAAAEGADGLPEGAMISAIRESQQALLIERTSSDALTFALRSVLGSGKVTCTVKELFDRISHMEERNLPGSPAALSSALERQRGALLAVGISVNILQRGKQGRKVEIEYVGPPEDAPKPPIFGNY